MAMFRRTMMDAADTEAALEAEGQGSPETEASCCRCANNNCGHMESILDAEMPEQVI